MMWQEKMEKVLREVLGNEYILLIQSKQRFLIIVGVEAILDVESIYELESHWRDEIKKAILRIVEDRITEKLKIK